ncbi:hypothetical protein E2C01_052501 [Portunus trituberculatus]|uniref:Uncharacterized protein n=1 Tax=Portunus trituberculatus TaxID=210409 RepID=A0A5B7GM15_PORTR|nr:hypothetical protein [Portunus trituberculatus]
MSKLKVEMRPSTKGVSAVSRPPARSRGVVSCIRSEVSLHTWLHWSLNGIQEKGEEEEEEEEKEEEGEKEGERSV